MAALDKLNSKNTLNCLSLSVFPPHLLYRHIFLWLSSDFYLQSTSLITITSLQLA